MATHEMGCVLELKLGIQVLSFLGAEQSTRFAILFTKLWIIANCFLLFDSSLSGDFTTPVICLQQRVILIAAVIS